MRNSWAMLEMKSFWWRRLSRAGFRLSRISMPEAAMESAKRTVSMTRLWPALAATNKSAPMHRRVKPSWRATIWTAVRKKMSLW